MDYLLGIDIGTGSTKAVAVGNNGQVITSFSVKYLSENPSPGYYEQNADVLWEAFKTCFKHILSILKTPPKAVSFSCAMHAIAVFSEKGVSKTNFIIWSDVRAATIAENIKASPQGKGIYKNTGTPIHALSPLCKIIWLKEHLKAVFSEPVKFIGIKEYIWFKLFEVFEIDYSIASATGLFDINKKKWYSKSLLLANISSGELSNPVPTMYYRKSINKEIAAELGLKTNIPFVIGASDGCLANLGSMVFEKKKAALTIGTSGAVRVTGTKPILNFKSQIFNYILTDDIFISGGAVNNGGSAMDWAIKNFLAKADELSIADYHLAFNHINDAPAGSDGLVFIPYLNGERSPIWDENSCGVIIGFKQHHSEKHFLRAVLEGICFAHLHVLEHLENAANPVEELYISGGFIKSAVWVQLLADITGKKLVTIQNNDASAIGAVFLAQKALELIKNFNELSVPQHVETVLPDFERHLLYKERFEIYKSLYPKLIKIMHQLS